MKESDILYEKEGHYVTKTKRGYVVWRHRGTHAVSDNTYPANADGLSIAKARVDYLARGINVKKTYLHANPIDETKRPKRRKRRVVRRKLRRRDDRSALRFTRKARTRKLRRQWKDIYRSARRRGYSKGRAIAQASGVVAKETLRHNPQHRFIIEAIVAKRPGFMPDFRYWQDEKERFVVRRELATRYASKDGAYKEAKKLLSRVTDSVQGLRVVPG